jgi:hypothetical protein
MSRKQSLVDHAWEDNLFTARWLALTPATCVSMAVALIGLAVEVASAFVKPSPMSVEEVCTFCKRYRLKNDSSEKPLSKATFPSIL